MLFMVIFLMILVISLLIYIVVNHLRVKRFNHNLILLKTGEKIKLFTKGNDLLYEITLNINQIMNDYERELEKLLKNEKVNKELLTSLSHDLRTPLTSLLGYLEALESNVVNDEEEAKRYKQVALNKAHELKDFVDTLFDWFKIHSLEYHYHFELVDLNEYSREILIDWLPTFERYNITYDVEIVDDVYHCQIDQNAYKRIINNLIQNVLTHSQSSYLKLSVTKSENQYIILIEDHGKGIHKDQIDYIFERLYKCDDARTTRSSGLGLSIVKELVLAHKGEIIVESIEKQKTVFTIKLPM